MQKHISSTMVCANVLFVHVAHQPVCWFAVPWSCVFRGMFPYGGILNHMMMMMFRRVPMDRRTERLQMKLLLLSSTCRTLCITYCKPNYFASSHPHPQMEHCAPAGRYGGGGTLGLQLSGYRARDDWRDTGVQAVGFFFF